MHRLQESGLAAAVVAAAMFAPATTATAAPAPEATTHVDSVSVTQSAGSLAVSGQASFAGSSLQVGEDPTGDVLNLGYPTIHEPPGSDLIAAHIARPDPFEPVLTFTLDVANQPPVLNGAPEVVNYRWGLSVDGGEWLYLWAVRSAQLAGGPGLDPVFELFKCEDDGLRTPVGTKTDCPTVATLQGTMADGAVQWQVPMSRIAAKPGSVIRSLPAGSYMGTTISGATVFFNRDANGLGLRDEMSVEDYLVNGPVVEVGIAPAGTPAESVELTDIADVDNSGSFSALIPAPAEPGEYVVVARACHGFAWVSAGNCGFATTTVTI